MRSRYRAGDNTPRCARGSLWERSRRWDCWGSSSKRVWRGGRRPAGARPAPAGSWFAASARSDTALPGEHGAALVDGVPRLGHDRDVTRIEHRDSQVRDAFLRADEGVELRERIESRAEAAFHVRGRGLAEGGEAHLERVATHRGIAEGPAERVDRDLGRREVRVPGTHVDDVDPLLDEPTLDRRDLGHRIGGQRRQPLAELSHAWASPQIRASYPKNLPSDGTSRYRP